MSKFIAIKLILLLMVFSAFSQEVNKKVVIKTNLGDIEIELYNETPKHRDNFLKLIENHFYDSLLFHRVISDFMIQAGDPSSKNAKAGEILGNGGPGYVIEAEINPKLIHKNGALAAARLGDATNPKRNSSGSQFYIVDGPVYSLDVLKKIEMSMKKGQKSKLFLKYLAKKENIKIKQKLDSLQRVGNREELNMLAKNITKALSSELSKIENENLFTEEQLETYTTIGGAPHLDGQYTVFGQVIKGMDVVDKISKLEVDKNSRPLVDFKINTIEIIK